MKNLSLLLNVVLVIAVAILFYLHFSSSKGAQTSGAVSTTPGDTSAVKNDAVLNKDSRIYYVNIDTINDKYQLLLDLGKEVKSKSSALESGYQANMQKYQEGMMLYQQKLQENKITAEEAQRTEEQLRQLGQKIQNAERDLDILADEMAKKNLEARKELEAYLKEYKEGKGIDFIFGYSLAAPTILFADQGLDVTNEVLKGLNERYEAKKNQPKK